MADRYFGKYTGVVKDNRDADHLGRIQVSVPALFPEDEQMQARPALPYGFYFVPDTDAKVWVEFEGGDPSLPIWSGIQITPGDWPSEAEADPPQKRVIRTAAGHVLAFHDASGEEQVELRDGANGHVIHLDGQEVRIEDGVNGHAIHLDGQGVRIEDGANGHKLSLTSQGVTVEGGNGIGTITLAASGVKVETSAIVEVKGSLVRLGDGSSFVARMGDSGIGNLGAPVTLTVVTNMKVMA